MQGLFQTYELHEQLVNSRASRGPLEVNPKFQVSEYSVMKFHYGGRLPSEGEFWIFFIERAWMGPSCVKVVADLSQWFQRDGRNCEHAKLRMVCATCRIIEKQDSEHKIAISHSKN